MGAARPDLHLVCVEAARFVSGRFALYGQRAGIMHVKIEKSANTVLYAFEKFLQIVKNRLSRLWNANEIYFAGRHLCL
jgi:hypothetical protein